MYFQIAYLEGHTTTKNKFQKRAPPHLPSPLSVDHKKNCTLAMHLFGLAAPQISHLICFVCQVMYLSEYLNRRILRF